MSTIIRCHDCCARFMSPVQDIFGYSARLARVLGWQQMFDRNLWRYIWLCPACVAECKQQRKGPTS